MKTKVLVSIIAIVLVVSISLVVAHENFNETKELIDSNISCDKLSDEQLEEIGDYYMEQMHPGESHEAMHNMMGGEDSGTVKQMHTNMAKMMYCDNGEGMNNMMNMMSSGMMNGMMGMGGGGMMNMNDNMMGSGMMGNNIMGGRMMGGQTPQTSMMRGMTGNFGYLGYKNGYWNFLNVLYITLLIALIILVFLFIAKLLIYKKN